MNQFERAAQEPYLTKAAYNRIYSRTSRGCLVSLAIAILFGVLIAAQTACAGGHGSGSHSTGGTVHVSGYSRKDGTYVHPYDRAAPGYGSYSTSASRVDEPTLSTTSTASAATAASTQTYVAPIPANATVRVHEYDRQDGRHVKEYVRSAPGYADTVVAVASSPKRENQTLPKSSSRVSTSVGSTNAAASHYSIVPYANSTTSDVQRDAHGRIKRSEAAKREFMRQTGHLHGWAGHVVDHIKPLKRGGCDCPENMQWQTVEEAKSKDKWE